MIRVDAKILKTFNGTICLNDFLIFFQQSTGLNLMLLAMFIRKLYLLIYFLFKKKMNIFLKMIDIKVKNQAKKNKLLHC